MGEPPSILVVDDDPDILDAMVFVLEQAGYRVATAADGAEALARLRGGAAPCLVLLDLMMPVLDGWQLLGELAREPALAAIPVVVLTGAGAAARSATSLGARSILEKPVSLDALLATVERYCGSAPAGQGGSAGEPG